MDQLALVIYLSLYRRNIFVGVNHIPLLQVVVVVESLSKLIDELRAIKENFSLVL